jgi:hypothetical protein
VNLIDAKATQKRNRAQFLFHQKPHRTWQHSRDQTRHETHAVSFDDSEAMAFYESFELGTRQGVLSVQSEPPSDRDHKMQQTRTVAVIVENKLSVSFQQIRQRPYAGFPQRGLGI